MKARAWLGLAAATLAACAVVVALGVGFASPASAHGGGLPFYGIVEVEGLEVEAGHLVVLPTPAGDLNRIRTVMAENGISLIDQRQDGTIAGLTDPDPAKMLAARAFARTVDGVADAFFEPVSPEHQESRSSTAPATYEAPAPSAPSSGPATPDLPSPWRALLVGFFACCVVGALAALFVAPADEPDTRPDTEDREPPADPPSPSPDTAAAREQAT